MVARVPLFAPMDESEIGEIRAAYTRVYLPGVPIVRTGDAGDAMFVIAGGEAVVELEARAAEILLKDGDFFWGEMALLGQRLSSTTWSPKRGAVSTCSTRRRARLSRAASGDSGSDSRNNGRPRRRQGGARRTPQAQSAASQECRRRAAAGLTVTRPRGRPSLAQIGVDLVEKAAGGEPALVGADEQREVLGHEPGFDGRDRHAPASRRRIASSALSSSLAQCFSAPVQAKIEAVALVEVSRPC